MHVETKTKMYGVMEYWTNASGWSVNGSSIIGLCTERNLSSMREKIKEENKKDPRRHLYITELEFILPKDLELEINGGDSNDL